jgi:hypothetical protein
LGKEYLVNNSDILGYDIDKAQLAKKRKHRAYEKVDATTGDVGF